MVRLAADQVHVGQGSGIIIEITSHEFVVDGQHTEFTSRAESDVSGGLVNVLGVAFDVTGRAVAYGELLLNTVTFFLAEARFKGHVRNCRNNNLAFKFEFLVDDKEVLIRDQVLSENRRVGASRWICPWN